MTKNVEYTTVYEAPAVTRDSEHTIIEGFKVCTTADPQHINRPKSNIWNEYVDHFKISTFLKIQKLFRFEFLPEFIPNTNYFVRDIFEEMWILLIQIYESGRIYNINRKVDFLNTLFDFLYVLFFKYHLDSIIIPI